MGGCGGVSKLVSESRACLISKRYELMLLVVDPDNCSQSRW